MSLIQPVKFREMETECYKIVAKVKSCFEIGVIIASGHTYLPFSRRLDIMKEARSDNFDR